VLRRPQSERTKQWPRSLRDKFFFKCLALKNCFPILLQQDQALGDKKQKNQSKRKNLDEKIGH
jgi:hypothetical protein